ncbi:MAG: GAF domain-containing protein [Symploca sp. SIO1B1]|nr:GAF domain-containing protein [Symploca sp. SIO1C2]NER95469.1 GAF domain-containing protein [Symploca sp. SIO1B1]
MQPSSSSDPPTSSEPLIERFGAITRKIRQFLDLDYILNTAVTDMRELLQIDRLLIYRFNPDWSGYVMIESVASGWIPLLSQVIDDPCFKTKWAQRYQQGRVRAISDVNKSNIRPCHLGLLTKLQVRANVVIPILPGNSLWGLLIAHQCSGPKQWSNSEVDLLKHLTLQIKSAIRQAEAAQQSQTVLLESQRAEAERQKLNQELEARVQERTEQLRQANEQLQAEITKRLQVQQGLQESQICLQLINAISTAKTTGFSQEQIIEQTLSKIHHFFSNLGVSYSTIEGKSKLRIIQASEPPGMQLPKDLATDLKAVPDYLHLLRQGELMITEDATQEPMLAPLAGWMHSCNTQALLAVPLRQSDKFVGLLSLHASTPRSWSEYQVGTMMEIAEYLSNSLQEAQEQQKRKQAEQALRESERKFHAIFNQTFQFIGLMSPEGVLLEANQRALELAGLQAEEVIHRPLWEAGWWKMSPATQAGLQKAITQAAAGRFVRYEVNHFGPEDTVAIIDFSIKPVRDETGKVVLLISEGRDITEHKQALEELQQFNQQLETKIRERTTDLIEANQRLLAEVEERRRAEQSLNQIPDITEHQFEPIPQPSLTIQTVEPTNIFDTILRASVDHIYLIDREGKYLYANPEGLKAWVWELGDLVSNTGQKLGFAAEEREKLERQRQEVLRTGKPTSGEIYLTRVDGIRYYHYLISPVLNKKNQVEQVVIISRDITEYKQAENQIRESLQEKKTLLQEMHHRTKNSLQIICDLLHLYSRSLGEQQVLKLFEDSQNRVKAIWQIHEQLYQEDNSAQIDFPEHVTTLVNHICRSYGAESRAINCNVNAEPVLLTAKTALPCSLIINELVCNSLKSAFPDQQGGEIGVSIQNNQSQNQLILTVSDNGVGIPKDFDWYNSNSVGLQLVRSLTKQLEGSIELNLSKGTEFQIILSISSF